MTPFETKEKPKDDHLHVFGYDAYAHISKDDRKKLDSKSRKCILVGYGQETKGYRVYDPKRERIIYSRDVKFNEVKLWHNVKTTDSNSKICTCSYCCTYRVIVYNIYNAPLS